MNLMKTYLILFLSNFTFYLVASAVLASSSSFFLTFGFFFNSSFLVFSVMSYSFFFSLLVLFVFYSKLSSMSFFSYTLLFLVFMYLFCLLAASSCNISFVILGYTLSSVFGIMCMTKGMSTNTDSFFLVFFFSLLCDFFLYLVYSYFFMMDLGLSPNNFKGVGSSGLFHVISFCFFFKSGLGVFSFWVYYAMNSCLFISCFLHTSGVVSLGLVFFFKFSCYLLLEDLYFYLYFFFFSCCFCFFLVISQVNLKSNMGIMTCFSYGVMFTLLLLGDYAFFSFYFLGHSFFKAFSFFFNFFLKKYANNKDIICLLYGFFFFLFVFFVFCFDFFGQTAEKGFFKEGHFVVEFLLCLEFSCYFKVAFSFFYSGFEKGLLFSFFFYFYFFCFFYYFAVLGLCYYFLFSFFFCFLLSVVSFFFYSYFSTTSSKITKGLSKLTFSLFSSEVFLELTFLFVSIFEAILFYAIKTVEFFFFNHWFFVFFFLFFGFPMLCL